MKQAIEDLKKITVQGKDGEVLGFDDFDVRLDEKPEPVANHSSDHYIVDTQVPVINPAINRRGRVDRDVPEVKDLGTSVFEVVDTTVEPCSKCGTLVHKPECTDAPEEPS